MAAEVYTVCATREQESASHYVCACAVLQSRLIFSSQLFSLSFKFNHDQSDGFLAADQRY